MNERITNPLRWPVFLFVAVILIGVGSAATYLIMRNQTSDRARAHDQADAAHATASSSDGSAASGAGLRSDVSITLSQEAINRAGIVVTQATASTGAGYLRVPAVVEPNGYRAVAVTPIVAGRVIDVSALLGQHVTRGQSLARVYSPELADAQSRYLAAKAALDAHEHELRRTEKLVELGSASRQELEKIHAEHTSAVSVVQSGRSQLILLGMTPQQVDKLTSPAGITATAEIPAPIDGVITERAANPGQNVDTAAKLFTVVDLSTVWLVGSLYERDFGRVHVGSPVTITVSAYPAMKREGKVSYVDPQVDSDTRTAQLRVELPNRDASLRPGMYAEMQVGEVPAERVVVPRAAVQMIGDRAVVYLADSATAGRFVEREVRLGAAIDDRVEIASGIGAAESVVTQGSFALRAERERLGLRPTGSDRSRTSATRIIVSEKGFEPARVSVKAGVPARLTFVRTTDATCATEIAVPALKIKKPLPLNQPVDIELTPREPGDIAFACGMDMFRGTIVVEP